MAVEGQARGAAVTRPRRRSAARLAAVASLAAVAVLFPATLAEACSCVFRAVPQQLAAADTVFVGSVRSLASAGAPELRRPVRFDVSSVYKGNPGTSVTVSAFGEGNTCGVPFAEHKTYAVFAARDGDTLVTDLCSGTTDDLSAVAGLTPVSNAKGGSHGSVSAPAASRAAWLGAAALLLGVVSAASVFARRMARRPRPFA
jgi:hypothetical protein